MAVVFFLAFGLTYMQFNAKLVFPSRSVGDQLVSPAGNDENSSAVLNVSAASKTAKKPGVIYMSDSDNDFQSE